VNASGGIAEAPVFERRFLSGFLLVLLAILAGGTAVLFLSFRVIFTRPLPSTYSGIHFALRDLSSFLAPILFFSTLAYVLVMGVAVATLCVYAFHRIAGALYRIEAAIENMRSGDPVKAVFLRRRDQLVPLGLAFNAFVASLRKDRQEWLDAMENAERLCMRDPAACRAEMEDALGRITSLLSRYR